MVRLPVLYPGFLVFVGINFALPTARAVREAEIGGVTSGMGNGNKNVQRLDLKKRLQSWLSYKKLMIKIGLYEWLCWARRGRGD